MSTTRNPYTVEELHALEVKSVKTAMANAAKQVEKWDPVKALSTTNLEHYESFVDKVAKASAKLKELEATGELAKHDKAFIKTATQREQAIKNARKKSLQAKTTQDEVMTKCEINFNDKALKILGRKKISPLSCEIQDQLIVAFITKKDKKRDIEITHKLTIGNTQDLTK